MTSKMELLVWYPNETVTFYWLIESSLHTNSFRSRKNLRKCLLL